MRCRLVFDAIPQTGRTYRRSEDEASTETARIVARVTGGKVRSVRELADPDLGLLEGLHLREFAERYPKRHKGWQEDPLSLIPPEGEPIAEARARIFDTVARILRKTRAAEVGIVLRPVGFGLLRCWFADQAADGLWHELGHAPPTVRYVVSTNVIAALRDAARVEVVS